MGAADGRWGLLLYGWHGLRLQYPDMPVYLARLYGLLVWWLRMLIKIFSQTT